MTDDGPDVTRRIPWHDDVEAAATQDSRHRYPRAERLARIDQDVARFAERAERAGIWALVALLTTGCLVAVVLGIVL